VRASAVVLRCGRYARSRSNSIRSANPCREFRQVSEDTSVRALENFAIPASNHQSHFARHRKLRYFRRVAYARTRSIQQRTIFRIARARKCVVKFLFLVKSVSPPNPPWNFRISHGRFPPWYDTRGATLVKRQMHVKARQQQVRQQSLRRSVGQKTRSESHRPQRFLGVNRTAVCELSLNQISRIQNSMAVY
jgi:hypothetical protein